MFLKKGTTEPLNVFGNSSNVDFKIRISVSNISESFGSSESRGYPDNFKILEPNERLGTNNGICVCINIIANAFLNIVLYYYSMQR